MHCRRLLLAQKQIVRLSVSVYLCLLLHLPLALFLHLQKLSLSEFLIIAQSSFTDFIRMEVDCNLTVSEKTNKLGIKTAYV